MPLNRAWLCFSPETEFREQYLAYGTLWGIGAEGQHFGVCAEWVCEGTSRTNGSLVSWAGETWSLTHRKDYQGKMYYFHLQFKQPDVLVLMCDFKSISQVYQHSSPFSVQGSISLWPPAPTHPGICPEHPTAARLDWDLGNEEAKSNTSHCCRLSLTWNGQYDPSGLVILTTSPVSGQDVVSDRWTRVYGNHTCRPTWACTHALD